MALLKFKRSAIPSRVPTTSDLALGELALNTYDGKVYMKKDDGTQAIVEVGGASGGGTVTSVAATAGTGISVSGSPITTSGTLTITNTAPDQTVTLTQAGTTTITGTYPNFTISSADQYDGTVTSVSGTGTVNGLTLSGTVTSSGSLTLGGTLSGIDLTSQITGTLPVANGGTGATSLTSGYVLKGNGTSPVSASVIYDDGTNVGIGTSSPSAVGSRTTVNVSGSAGSAIRLSDDTANTFIDYTDGSGARISVNAAEPLLFQTNSLERMRIDSSGNLGLGTTSPTNLLDLNGGITVQQAADVKWQNTARNTTYGGISSLASALQFKWNGSEKMRITSSGSVGIGTTSPDSKVDIEAANSQLRLTDSDDSKFVEFSYSSGKLITRNNSTSTTVNQFTLDESGRFGLGTISPSAKMDVVTSGANVAKFSGTNTYVDIVDSTVTGRLQAAGNVFSIGTTASGDYLIFKTDAGSERARITSGGELVVNRTSSLNGGKLSVLGSTSQAITAQVDNNAYSTFQGFNAAGTMSFQATGAGAVTATTSVSSPIFYDSNNTAYYVDLTSSTSLNAAGSLIASGNITLNNGANRRVRLGSATNYYYDLQSTGNDFQIIEAGTTPRLTISYPSGAVTAATDFRAPIFYDSNNTAYYADFGSTGSSIRTAGSVSVGTTSSAVQLTVAGAGGVDGIELQVDTTNSVNSGRMFWTNGTAGQGVAIYNGSGNMYLTTGATPNSTSGGTRMAIYSGNYVTASGSFRAPIFYDSDNTAFYFNGASTTNINGLSGNGKTVLETSDSYLRINQSAAFSSGIWFGSSNMLQGSSKYIGAGGNGGTTSSRVYIYGGTYNGVNVISIDGSNGRVTALDSRAEVFYDRNNTAYYADPASESVLNTVTFFGELNLSAAGQTYVDHTGTIIFRNQSGYATSATLTTSGNFTATGNVTAYSDIRVKDNVKQIEGALDKVQAIRGVTYNRTDLEDTERRYGGVIAQEIEKVLPEAIFESDDRKAVDYNATIGLLIEAIKELKAEVETLKKG